MKARMTMPGQSWRTYFSGPRRGALLGALVTLALLLPIWWQAGRWYQVWLLADQRTQLAADLTYYGNALTSTVRQRLALLEELSAFVQTNQRSRPDRMLGSAFETFAAGLYANSYGTRYFFVAPAGVQRYVYPQTGNADILGHDLIRAELPATRAEVRRAIESGQLVLSGPHELPQGGLGLVAYLPVYQDDTFWGLVGMALDLSPILTEVGLDVRPASLNLALRDQVDHVFYGQSMVFAANPVIYPVKLPEGTWDLAGVPTGGWQASIQNGLLLFQGTGLTIVFLCVGLVYLVINRQARLALAVQQRTHEILEINQEMVRDIKQRQRTEAALRETQRALATLMSNLPGMAYRGRNDSGRTLHFVSEGCFDLTGYYPDDLIGNYQIAYMELIHPADRPMVWQEIQVAVQEDRPFQIIYRLTTATGEVKWVWEKGRGVYSDEGYLLALEGFITDTTERVLAYQMLEQRVADRTRELSALYDVTAVASESLDLTVILERSLEEILTVMDRQAGAIHLFDLTEQVLRLAMGHGISPEVMAEVESLRPNRGLVGWVFEHREPLVVPTIAADPRAAEALLARDDQSYAGAPMRARGQVLGVLSIIGEAEQQFKVEEVALLASIADQVGVAVENAQLYEAERTRRRQADTLLQIASVVGSTLELDEVLDRILDQLHRVVDYESASVQLWQEDRLQVIAARGFADGSPALDDSLASAEAPNQQVLAEGRPLNLVDAPSLYPVFRQPPYTHIRSWLGVPLRVQERVIGMISLGRQPPGGFLEEEVQLVTAFADQAALALENARLYRQAEQLAVMEERGRLARELHDSVTQSLYSLNLLAEAGRRLASTGDIERATDYLARLGETAQQALREMRLLVYELRPLVLDTEGLIGALQQRLDAVEKRAGVKGRLLVETEVELPPAVEEGLYRIAQEALNNALKHAAAQSVTVRLSSDAEAVELEVSDDGRGFDPGAVVDRGGLGLISMRERAEQLGGSCQLLSAPEQGTTVRVRITFQEASVQTRSLLSLAEVS